MYIIPICIVCLFAFNTPSYAFEGIATWYGRGVGTASGQRFNPNGLTCAHKTLPFGTKLLLTNKANERSVTVIVNDRGPFGKNREIDVTYGAAKILGFVSQGIAILKIEVIKD